MIEIEKPRIETEELTEDGKYGKFVVEPLERGFGNTLGCFPLLKAVLLHQSRLTAFFTNFQLFPA